MRWMLGHPRLALALLAVAVLAPLPASLHLEINNAVQTYFPEDHAAAQFDRQLREDFPEDEVLIGLFEGPDLFEADFLRRLHATAGALERHERVERVRAVTNADHIRSTPEGFSVERLIPADRLGERSSAAWRERALGDAFAPGLLLAPEGEAMALILRPEPLESSLQRQAIQELFHEEVAEHGIEGPLTAVGGDIALDAAQLASILADLSWLSPITFVLAMALLWALFRSLPILLLAAATISASTATAMAVLVLLGAPFSLITAIVPPLLTALTTAMIMHLVNGTDHFAQRGLTGRERVEATLGVVARPTLFMAATTAAGLLSLSLSPIPPIASLGVIAAAGVALSAMLVLLVLPALLLRFEPRRRPRRRGIRWLDAIPRAATRLGTRHPAWTLTLFGLVVAAAIPLAAQVKAETNFYEYFAEDHPLSRATDRIEQELVGVMPLEVVFTGPELDSLLEPRHLNAIHEVQEWLDQRPEVDYSLSKPDLVAEMHSAFHDRDFEDGRLPEDPALIAQYLFIHDGDDLFDLVDEGYQRTRLALQLNSYTSGELQALADDLEASLEARLPSELDAEVAGMGRLLADLERLLVQGQLYSLLVVAALILLLMAAIWRSTGLTLASMIPNLAPVLLIFAVMGLLGRTLDMATAMIASIAIGIAVDDTIHYLHGYRRRRARGTPPVWAIARTSRQAGRAVTATTIVLAAQFVLLGASDFQPTAAFGVLTAFGLLMAWLVDLLVLPSLLLLGTRITAASRRAGRG